jgi:predicted transcriptional regulator
MTLTVRLKPDIESALELHCAKRGVTKSLLVQEVLAEYLARPEVRREPATRSAAYRAFEAAGFIGAGRSDGRPADKTRVREVIAQRMATKKAGRGPA